MPLARPAPRGSALLRLAGLMLGALLCAAPAAAERVYVYGNSLVNHPDAARTNVPYWLGRLAAAGDQELALDGQWGFLRDFTAKPAAPQWSDEGVPGLGPGGPGSADTVVVTPTNFIQYQPAGEPYDGDDITPLAATLALLDRVPEARVLIYEGWADMGSFLRRFPPSNRQLRRYHAFNRGDYHDWYLDYVGALRAARPEARIGLIPVAPVLSGLMTSAPLDALGAEDFYSDDAPHGTEETYFLAAMVVYAALYDVAPPEGFAPPDTLDPVVAGAYEALRATVWAEVQDLRVETGPPLPASVADPTEAASDRADAGAGDAAPVPVAQGDMTERADAAGAASGGAAEEPAGTGPEDVAEDGDGLAGRDTPAAAGDETETETAGPDAESPDAESPVTVAAAAALPSADAPFPDRRPVALPPSGARPDGVPALGMGLNGISDWSTQQPFLDVMKTAREWIGHLPGQWGGVTAEELRAGGHLDENGWPRRIPDGVDRLESFVLTDQPEAAEHLRGAYVLRYSGRGEIELTGRASRVYYQPGEIRFHYEPGEGPVGIALRSLDAGDPIRDIRIVREDYLALHETGELFNPDWIGRIRDMRALRFMDWMFTNGSPVSGWDDRPRMTDYTWSAWGVPLPVMIALANRIGADPWFTLPHRADDAYIRAFAEAVRDGLDPRLKAYVEYSNEVWNGIFAQHGWAARQAEARWGESEAGWAQFYGLRAAQVMDIWTEVFGDAAKDRLTRVIAVHTGWPGLEETMLDAPLAFLELGRMPRESFDAYAVAAYFGHDLGDPETLEAVNGWLDRAEDGARTAGEAQGLRRVALREYVRQHHFEAAIPLAEMAVREGSLAELTGSLLPYHAATARRAGLHLVAYEGGTHAVGYGPAVEDERLAAFLNVFSYTPEMAGLYQELLSEWTALGGRLFTAFVDVAAPSKWGSWGALRHLDDANPRWDVLLAHNATAPVDWEERDPAAFANGVTRVAAAQGGRLLGTPHEDVLIGGPGRDEFVTEGGTDRVHGGEGRDRVRLPGRRAEYRIDTGDGRVVATRGRDSTHLVAVEEMTFDGEPGTVVPTN